MRILKGVGNYQLVDTTLRSDSSIPFRCQPAGHLAQSLQHSLRESCSFFIWGRLTMRAQYSAPYEKSPSANAERLCRGEGIRTLGKLETYTRFPSVLLKPLGHPSISARGVAKIVIYFDESKKESISFLN